MRDLFRDLRISFYSYALTNPNCSQYINQNDCQVSATMETGRLVCVRVCVSVRVCVCV